MATLTAAISATETTIAVSGAVDIGHYTIDDEALYVHGSSRGPDGRTFRRLHLSVDRAVGGTTAATHLSGATLTRYYPDAAGGGAGGVTVDNQSDPPAAVTSLIIPTAVITGSEADLSALADVQTISLLGPYPVAFNTAGLWTGSFNVVVGPELATGTLVMDGYAFITATWDGAADRALHVAITASSDLSNYGTLRSWSLEPAVGSVTLDLNHYAVPTTGTPVSPNIQGHAWIAIPFLLGEPSRIVISAGGVDPAPTIGTADVYVLIAQPSA